ncbi:hypothetical protein [uncultured Psychroserpens sp.]|uniref:transglutaminase domain-containing protein n=1 Tax=uncultured Psychroserpens sp. TaxID=255436 RepID=UPI002612EB07|nr:hypothetical protein [uncultured Psychroserpens sp.]
MRFKLLSKSTSKNLVDDLFYNKVNSLDDIPKLFFDINDEIFQDQEDASDMQKMQTIVSWLRLNITGGRGLSLSSELALKQMLNNDGGVCSDLVQIFNNFCVINNLRVKEWGITHYPFNKKFGGHSFNEVYISELNKWVMVDISHCIVFKNDKDIYLSVLEWFELNAKDNNRLSYDCFLKGMPIKVNLLDLLYKDPATIPFVILNYKNSLYDKYLDRYRGYLPVFVIHFLIYLKGKSYRYEFPLHDYKKIFDFRQFLFS